MIRLFLVRHGESEWNILNKVQGQKDTALTDNGIRQAEKLAERLKKESIDFIYSSDLKRAYDTAKIVGDKLGLKVNKLEGLREINFGCWQGLSINEIKEKFREEHLIWMTKPHVLDLPGGETLISLQERVLKAVNSIIKRHEGKNILLVSHGAAIKTLILGILDIDVSNYRKISLDNVGISIIEFREHNPVIKVLNDTSHV